MERTGESGGGRGVETGKRERRKRGKKVGERKRGKKEGKEYERGGTGEREREIRGEREMAGREIVGERWGDSRNIEKWERRRDKNIWGREVERERGGRKSVEWRRTDGKKRGAYRGEPVGEKHI